ncbi:bifunctional folylpolyglutamate synthase/dihydrofolate synthase [Paenisporosarcina indica]|uniref:bifunctional folylpolyglutamate synthase/dihydrofolate synthase n=1 Tax=Paenisporosarcina indica TaxID=650093 RepID=UPI00094F73B8|nr:folylpolyglutamate synthase/dihydrofolate synthase family protein [Paenisporosarcina indica]
MFTSVDKVIEYIYSMDQKTERNGRLSRISAILEVLGNPHEGFRSVHIAGSNGKGSTLNALKEILTAEGLLVGSFISPHLERVNERIMMNDVMITDEQFIQYMNHIYPLLQEGQVGDGSNFFEILTVIAFMYYNDMKVDIALIETGIGGKFDSTNVITPLLSILTSIALDHTHILGNTLKEIATEKAGIIKAQVPVISAVKDKQSVAVIEAKAKAEQAPIYQLYNEFMIENVMQEAHYQRFSYQLNNETFNDLQLKMMGHHQVENASLAITAALLLNKYHSFTISEESIRRGLVTSSWAGRFEEITPNILIDGAHNPAGMDVLLQTIDQRFPSKKVHVVYTAIKDKDIGSVLKMLDEIASTLTITEIHAKNAALGEDIVKESQHPNKKLITDWQQAIDYALSLADDSSIVLVTGSLYFMSEARPYLKLKAHSEVV